MTTFEETAGLPSVLTTAVGNLPHTDPAAAVDLIEENLSSAPHAPQLSRCDPREQMWIQFTEGLPRFRVDLENLNYFFDTSGDPSSDVEEFYTRYLEILEGGSVDDFAIGTDYGRGIHLFLERLAEEERKRPFIKVQVTGPLSFALTVTDENKKPIFYHPMFRDVAVKGTGLKALWLLEQFRPYAEDVVVFFDEPSLSAYGSSAFLGVSEADVIESLDEVFSMALQGGGIPGVHCCGNTDWGLLMKTSARIINFDAVDYMDTIGIYSGELSQFLGRGGVLAWGAVPNTERVEKESADDVIQRVRSGIDGLSEAGVDRDLLTQKIVLTPACGCGGLSVEQANRVYEILGTLDSRADQGLFS